MRRALVVLALLGVASAAAPASATSVSVTNPLNGCTYTVWTPDVYTGYGPAPGFRTEGGFGESVSCP